jgi:hypothetical protein
MNRSVPVSCYRGFTRVNHWVAASCMIVLLISGFSFFHPSLFWMTNLFGGCQMTRWLHPIVGLLLVASFFLLLLQMWKLNLPRREDLEWSLKIGDVLKGNEENLLGAVFPQRGLDPGAARRTGIENVRYAACAGCHTMERGAGEMPLLRLDPGDQLPLGGDGRRYGQGRGLPGMQVLGQDLLPGQEPESRSGGR